MLRRNGPVIKPWKNVPFSAMGAHHGLFWLFVNAKLVGATSGGGFLVFNVFFIGISDYRHVVSDRSSV